VNDYAVALTQTAGYIPLDTAYRRNLIDLMGTILCNGDRASGSAYVIGLGGPLPVYTSWASEYTDSSLKLKYFSSDALTSIKLMQSGTITLPLAISVCG
jgi:hypothetical protein